MRVTISLDDRLAAEAEIRARDEGLSLSAWVRNAIEECLTRVDPAADALPFCLVTAGGGGPLPEIDLDRTSELTSADDVRDYSTSRARRM